MRRRRSMIPGSTYPPQQKQADERRADGVDLDCFLPRPLASQTDRFPMQVCSSTESRQLGTSLGKNSEACNLGIKASPAVL